MVDGEERSINDEIEAKEEEMFHRLLTGHVQPTGLSCEEIVDALAISSKSSSTPIELHIANAMPSASTLASMFNGASLNNLQVKQRISLFR